MQKENNLTIGQWCGQWFITNRHKWNGNTEGGYHNLIYGHILLNIGNMALSDLTEQMVTGFYDVLRSQRLSAGSIWRQLWTTPLLPTNFIQPSLQIFLRIILDSTKRSNR